MLTSNLISHPSPLSVASQTQPQKTCFLNLTHHLCTLCSFPGILISYLSSPVQLKFHIIYFRMLSLAESTLQYSSFSRLLKSFPSLMFHLLLIPELNAIQLLLPHFVENTLSEVTRNLSVSKSTGCPHFIEHVIFITVDYYLENALFGPLHSLMLTMTITSFLPNTCHILDYVPYIEVP